MSRPLQYGDPVQLGAFRLVDRVGESPAGVVYRATDPRGAQLLLTVLSRGAAADAAARDRFAAALRRPPAGSTVLAVETEGPAPWVALTPVTDREPALADARWLLDAVQLADRPAVEDPGHPDYLPYWADGTDGVQVVVAVSSPPIPPPPPPGRDRSVLLGLAVLVLVLLLGLLTFVLLLFLPAGSEPAPRPAPSVTGERSYPPPPRTPAPSPSGGRSTFGPGDRTYLMRPSGLGFTFRTEPGWSCLRDSRSPAPVVEWDCFDDDDPRQWVVLRSRPCPGPCGSAAQNRLRVAVEVRSGWRRVDAVTHTAEWKDPDSGNLFRLAASRFWDGGTPGSRRAPSTHLVADARWSAQGETVVRRIVADILANAR